MNQSEVWIWIHSEEVWVRGDVIHEDSDDVITVLPKNAPKLDAQMKLNRKDVFYVNPTSAEDMTSLHYLHEPAILDNLRERYGNECIYTYMGSALIAVNPYKKISEPKMIDYMTSKAATPHPFTIAENCFKNLNVLRRNQSIVISGESGAGKTETAKIVIKYLAERNRLSGTNKDENSLKLYEKLIQMSPILESFGNAKTSRNSNSSRFGKFMKLLYQNTPPVANQSGSTKPASLELMGAAIETYLLEKSRVVYQNEGEQNFHIFYSLLDALPSVCNISGKTQFRLAKKVISSSSSSSSGVVDPSHRLNIVNEAFLTLGISQQEIQNIWKILSALLYLGNVNFESLDTLEGPIAKISVATDAFNSNMNSLNYLKAAADLLSVEQPALQKIFLQREMETRGEKFKVPLNVREANFARDATIKAIYEALFNYIVKLINRSLLSSTAMDGNTNALAVAQLAISSSASSSTERFIGVLDIFGFESFDKNGFEQLLINYANEALQNTFNKQIFDKELQLFESEKIEVSMGECPNNLKCVELICSKNESIFTTLDTISRQPQPSDERFCEELHKLFTKKSKYFGSVHRKDMKNLFVINHFATAVKYTVGNTPNPSGKSYSTEETAADNAWIQKNNDAIPDGLEFLYQQSNLNEFRLLNPDLQVNKEQPKRRKSVMMKPTIVAIFSKSMSELNDLLESTTCHFIRCIKPNTLAKPNTFHISYVLEQIRALGILQACEILSISLPTRISYHELKSSLHNVVNKLITKFPMLNTTEGNVLLIATILRAFQIPEDSYRLGVNMAFFRPGQLAAVDRLLNNSVSSSKEAEQMIAKSIESAIVQYNSITEDISRISEQISKALDFVNHLQLRQESVRTQFTVLETSIENGGLDLPENISKLLGEIENKYNSQQNKRKDIFKEKSKVESLLLTKEMTIGKNKKSDLLLNEIDLHFFQLITEVEDSYSEQCHSCYESIHSTIEHLEEANNRPINPIFIKKMNSNDKLYETIMDRVSNVEQVINEVKLNAQRCKIDEAYSKYNLINELIVEVNNSTQELAQEIDFTVEGLQAHEGNDRFYSVYFMSFYHLLFNIDSMNNVNFEELEVKIQEMFDIFMSLFAFIHKIQDNARRFQSDIQSFQFIDESKAVPSKPPPPPAKLPTTTIQPPQSQEAQSSQQQHAPEKPPKKSGSVSYTLKDLKELKKRASATNTTEEAEKIAKEVVNTEVLPPEWKELFDPKTNRPYYVHRVTKHRQWQRPILSTNSNEDNATIQSGSTKESKQEARKEKIKSIRVQHNGQLPPNWREVIDKKSGRPYYVNDLTKERQWRRPENLITTTDISPQKIENIDRVSRRMSKRLSLEEIENMIQHGHDNQGQSSPKNNNTNKPNERENPLMALKSTPKQPASPASPASTGNKNKSANKSPPATSAPAPTPSYGNTTSGDQSTSVLKEERIQQSRRASAVIISEELTANYDLTESMRQTISYLIRIGYQIKTGYLQKQSKLLGRWRKRYFVLSEQKFYYFDSEKEYLAALKAFKNAPALSLKTDKQFLLTAKTQVSYTTTNNCFSLVNPDVESRISDDETWYILTENEK
jgi:myosin heavy subunit